MPKGTMSDSFTTREGGELVEQYAQHAAQSAR
jgi:hypothetical protein